MSDKFMDHLRWTDEIAKELKQGGVPNHLVEDFQRMVARMVNPNEEAGRKKLAALSEHLLSRLADYRSADKGSSPNRVRGLLPESTIAATTLEILSIYTDGFSGQPDLDHLVTALLNIKKQRAKSSRQPVARSAAMLTRIFAPDMTNGEIAKLVRVSKSTIGRWLKNKSFQDDMAEIGEMCAKMPAFKEVARNALSYNLHEIGGAEEELQAKIPK
jgi:hypothetical protein